MIIFNTCFIFFSLPIVFSEFCPDLHSITWQQLKVGSSLGDALSQPFFFFFFKAGALQAFQTPKCHLGMQGAAASSGWGSSRWHQHGYSAFQGGVGQGLWLWEGWEQGSAVGVEG